MVDDATAADAPKSTSWSCSGKRGGWHEAHQSLPGSHGHDIVVPMEEGRQEQPDLLKIILDRLDEMKRETKRDVVLQSNAVNVMLAQMTDMQEQVSSMRSEITTLTRRLSETETRPRPDSSQMMEVADLISGAPARKRKVSTAMESAGVVVAVSTKGSAASAHNAPPAENNYAAAAAAGTGKGAAAGPSFWFTTGPNGAAQSPQVSSGKGAAPVEKHGMRSNAVPAKVLPHVEPTVGRVDAPVREGPAAPPLAVLPRVETRDDGSFRRPTPAEHEARHVEMAVHALRRIDRRCTKLLIGDSHCRFIDGYVFTNSAYVVRVGGLCLPALATALLQSVPLSGVKHVVVAVGTNDLLHHTAQGYDHIGDMIHAYEAVRRTYPSARIEFVAPFQSPRLRQIRAPVDEFAEGLRTIRGITVHDAIDTNDLEFDGRRVHLVPAALGAFIDQLRVIFGASPSSPSRAVPTAARKGVSQNDVEELLRRILNTAGKQ
jgi:hypothetical protein